MRTRSVDGARSRGTVGGRAREADIERAAAEVLAEVGYAAASVDRIAQRAGVSKGVITYHFARKDDILRRVALTLFEECAAHIAARAEDDASPAHRLRARVRAELEFVAPRRVEFRAMAAVMANHREPGFVDAFDDVSTREVAKLADILRQGQAQGEFRAFDANDMARLITVVKNGVLDEWSSDPTLDLAATTETMLVFIDRGVRA